MDVLARNSSSRVLTRAVQSFDKVGSCVMKRMGSFTSPWLLLKRPLQRGSPECYLYIASHGRKCLARQVRPSSGSRSCSMRVTSEEGTSPVPPIAPTTAKSPSDRGAIAMSRSLLLQNVLGKRQSRSRSVGCSCCSESAQRGFLVQAYG
jgi:hypothetical protein